MYNIFIKTIIVNDIEYEFWKKLSVSPANISYALFEGDSIVLECMLDFRLYMKHSDPNWITSYDILDDSMAKAMEQHLRRNLVIKNNEEKIKKLKLERKLAAFDAMVAKKASQRKK